MNINETFGSETFSSLLSWHNPPAQWRVDRLRSRLVMEPDARTDFWQRTHYGFRAGSGHLLKAEVPGDAVISSKFQSYPVHQYDQAGLMVWFSDDCWLKTSVEFELDGTSQLGAVVTNQGYSDWSMQDFTLPKAAGNASAPGATASTGVVLSYCLRIRRTGEDFAVEYRPTEDRAWKLLRLAHLLPAPDRTCFGGVYACSPQDGGFRVEVEYLRIEPAP